MRRGTENGLFSKPTDLITGVDGVGELLGFDVVEGVFDVDDVLPEGVVVVVGGV